MDNIIDQIRNIFLEHKNERICVFGSSCVGKSTLVSQLPESVDLDDILWSELSEDILKYLDGPWTEELSDDFARIARDTVTITPGNPLFSTVIIDCDVLIYLDITKDLLEERCKKRKANINEVMAIKQRTDREYNEYLKNGGDAYYILL